MKAPLRSCIAIVALLALGAASASNEAAADEARIMAHLTLPFGSGDRSFGVRGEAFDGHWAESREAAPYLAVDLTTRLSHGRFESLNLNGAPILYADDANGGEGIQYALIGVAGAALILFAITDAFSDDLVDAIDKEIDEHLDD